MKAAFLAVALLGAACSAGPSRETGTFRIAVQYDLTTLDPHARDTLSNLAIASHFYEPLVATDGDMRIQPCLARSWENPDSSTWVFHLRPSVFFHGGKPFGAPDVVYSIRRLLADTRLEIAAYVLYVTEVTALDPMTVRIRTSRPPGVFLSKLRFVAIVPEGAKADALAGHPDGTGPYRLREWRSRELVALERNDAYWGRRPDLGRVEFLLNRGSEQAVDELLGGRCQLVEFSSRPLESRVAGAGASRFALVRVPSLFLKYIGFDLQREVTPHASVRPNPFRKRAVREAIHLALDRRRLVSELSTDAVPATQLVPSSFVFGYNPQVPAPRFDPERARALLRQEGLEKGFKATVHVRKIFPEAAYLVRDQLAQIGIELDVSVLGDEDFFERARGGELSLFISRIGTGTGDASDIIENALHSPDPARGWGSFNFGGYSNPQVDRAIEQSARLDDVTKRREVIEGILSRVLDDLAWVPLYVDQHVYALEKGLAWRPRGDNCILAAEISRKAS